MEVRHAAITRREAEGAAIWLRSEDARENLWRMARTGMLLSSLGFGPAGFGRMLRYARFIQQQRTESVPESHLYLFILGICPARQGRGVGGALLERGLARADAQGRACYLETARERNVRFYERHGFIVVWQAQVPEGGPRLWGMYRASFQ